MFKSSFWATSYGQAKRLTTLIAAKDYICQRYEEEFSYVYFLKKLDLVEQRFSTFKLILSIDGVKHDPG